MIDKRWCGVTAALVLALTLAAAPQPGGVTTKDFRIETDQTNSNLNDGSFTMPHRVRFFRPGTDVVGDSAKGNFKNGLVTITGHVVMHDAGGTSAPSATPRPGGLPVGGGPSTLTCDELQVDSKRKLYTALGNVVYVQGTRRATADKGVLDQLSHLLDLSGNVRLADADQTLTAQNVRYNTLTKDITTSGSPVIFSKPADGPTGTTSTLPTPAAKATVTPK